MAWMARKERNRGSRRRGLAGALLALGLGGCSLFMLSDVEAPDISLSDIRFLEATALEQKIEMDLRVRNPNDFPVTIDGLVVDLTLNGDRLAKAMSPQKLELPRLGEARFTLQSVTSTFDLIAGLYELGTEGKLQYGLEGHTYLLRDQDRLKVPFDHTGQLALD